MVRTEMVRAEKVTNAVVAPLCDRVDARAATLDMIMPPAQSPEAAPPRIKTVQIKASLKLLFVNKETVQ